MLQNKVHSPILVTGVERSGSSIIARIISLCGATIGDVTDMYENIRVKYMLDEFYTTLGVDVKGQFPLPSLKRQGVPDNWKQKIDGVFCLEQYNKKQPWMFKSSRIGQTWQMWHVAFPDAKWIIVRRRPNDIIESCLKTGYMTAFKDKAGWLKWVHMHEKIFVSMIEAGVNCKQIWPERMVNGDYQQIIEMIEWVGLVWEPKIIEVIDPLLWNSKQREKKGV
jgi:hypothetical protein